MSQMTYPLWYPFQEIELKQFNPKMEEIRQIILRRIELYKTKEDFDFKKDRWETEEQFKERALEDRKGYSLMRIGASIDETRSSYLGKWFIEEEGDLFEIRFRNADWETKSKIMNALFPIDDFGRNWMDIADLATLLGKDLRTEFGLRSEEALQSSKFSKLETTPEQGLYRYLGINFRYATDIVQNRRSLVHQGWVIATMDRLLSTVKKRFEAVLLQDLIDFGERIKTEAPGPVKTRSEEINSLMKELSPRSEYQFSHFQFEGTIDDNLILLPPCIQDLMMTMKESGYIPHGERFQLGLFLKHTGMSLQEQMDYWFNLAVDNQNITYEEFEKRVGYVIRHLYGLEGKKTDYEMLACDTIHSSGSYYCRFHDLELSDIEKKFGSFNTKQDGRTQMRNINLFKEEFLPNIQQSKFSEACATHLKMTLNVKRMSITHPMQYLEMAAKTSSKVKMTMKDEQQENQKKDETTLKEVDTDDRKA